MYVNKILTLFFWSTINTGGSQMFGLIFGIVLARILSPEDFGVMAIISFICLMANVLVDSGFSHALIRDQKVTDREYNSVFYFSLTIGFICSAILFLSAELLANFFALPVLISITKIMSISPLLFSLMSINSTIITKQLNFKLKAQLSLSAMIVAGAVSVVMAMGGFGIWSLVTMQLLNTTLLMLFLWLKVRWRPGINCSFDAISKYVRFGLTISISNLANLLSVKSYVFVLGKYFSTSDAGYFARADSLKNLPTGILSKVISKVTYPLLSKFQQGSDAIRNTSVQIIKFTAVISIPIILGIASVAEELILILVGEKWLPSAQMLVFLCFAGVLLPLDTINMNIIKSHGNISTYLNLNILKIVLVFQVLSLGVVLGIKAMLIAIVLQSVIIFIVSSIFAGKIIRYTLATYTRDIWQPLFSSIFMFVCLTLLGEYLNFNHLLELMISVLLGGFLIIISYEIFKNSEYLVIKRSVLNACFNLH